MRTYTVRDVVGAGAGTCIVVDIVVHDGAGGPGNSWALAAVPGDQLAMLAPRRGRAYGGIEWAPEPGRQLLLVGDETAVAAICSILEQLPSTARGTAFLEVPVAEDLQAVAHPVGVELLWLPPGGAAHGSRLTTEVTAHLGVAAAPVELSADEVDRDLWETPTHSSSGEPIDPTGTAPSPHADLYAWIAGESKVVTGVRRHLVTGLGIDRRQVAFMGYWRRGVAMRS